MNNIHDYHFAPVLEEMLCGDAMTVVGNIIDNPELLGSQSPTNEFVGLSRANAPGDKAQADQPK